MGRPLRRELFRLLQGGDEFGDLTVLRPAEDAPAPAPAPDTLTQGEGKQLGGEKNLAGGKGEKGGKNDGKESIEDLESYLEKAMGSGSGVASPGSVNNNDNDQDDDTNEGQPKRSPQGGGQSGSTRKIGIPLGIRHLAILTRDDSNVLNSKVNYPPPPLFWPYYITPPVLTPLYQPLAQPHCITPPTLCQPLS